MFKAIGFLCNTCKNKLKKRETEKIYVSLIEKKKEFHVGSLALWTVWECYLYNMNVLTCVPFSDLGQAAD